ncbi:HAD family hydrolase [Nocardiopsis sp. TSRI0078]|uniref:HAD family hydrolase n=1 Tax=unclassified Nocardiopsis TaxID=2649073 RepID=UPI00093E2919|nr:HAD family phosphatase [Nocardiopsis sp. TSRI0078]OKI22945.1 HAD family hydrolase [Nocardiopsis sp. TSRI0078]
MTVLFDLFGVLACHQSEEGKDRLVQVAGAPAPAFWEAYWARRLSYDRADVTASEYWHRVGEDVGVRLDDRRIAALVEADIASWSAVDETMVALVGELAASGRRIGLLSNLPEELAVHYEAHHPWLGNFHVRAFSCRLGRAKPEPEAYRWCQEALGVEPGRILFVDDRQENVLGARETGMRAHLFTSAARLREELALGDADAPT